MASYNKVILLGNLTRDPELRSTPKGSYVTQLSLAVNRSYQGPDGNKVEETTFVDVDAFGKQAEVLCKYLTKGRPVLVEGRLKLNQWEKDGEKRSRLSVVLESFQFVGGRNDGGSSGYEASDSPAPSRRSSSSSAAADDVQGLPDDDDVPF